MCRNLLIAVAVACLASSCAAITEPDMNCTDAQVGNTFALDNPLSYYTCKDANTPLVFNCVEGNGYIHNGTQTGCVPWVLWDCTNKDGAPACTADQQLTKFPHVTPTLFWICQGLDLPEAISCPDDTAFIASGTNSGCQPWSVWSEECPY